TMRTSWEPFSVSYFPFCSVLPFLAGLSNFYQISETMKIEATTPEQYIEQLPDERKEAISKLRKVILENLPKGFSEEMSYGIIGYVVPKSIYPGGYHANPELPLPFINIASQKNHIAVYHSGIYAEKNLMDWF